MKLYVKYNEGALNKLLDHCMRQKIDVKVTISISEMYGVYVLIDKYYASLSFLDLVRSCGLEEAERKVKNG